MTLLLSHRRLLIAITVLALVVMACGGGGGATTTGAGTGTTAADTGTTAAGTGTTAAGTGTTAADTGTTSAATGDVVFWTGSTNPVDLAALRKIVDQFNGLGGATAELVEVTGSETEATALITAVRGGTGPDVYMLDRFTVAQRAADGLLEDLTQFADNPSRASSLSRRKRPLSMVRPMPCRSTPIPERSTTTSAYSRRRASTLPSSTPPTAQSPGTG